MDESHKLMPYIENAVNHQLIVTVKPAKNSNWIELKMNEKYLKFSNSCQHVAERLQIDAKETSSLALSDLFLNEAQSSTLLEFLTEEQTLNLEKHFAFPARNKISLYFNKIEFFSYEYESRRDDFRFIYTD